MKILHIVGNRPQFIKLAPFLRAAAAFPGLRHVLLHSGQHYDYLMSKIFLDELGLPAPDHNLNVGSGSHGVQTGRILEALDPVLAAERPDAVVVYGDTNTTLAGALAAHKMGLPLAHVEAGVREYIWRPEEINRKIADHCSDLCFCPLPKACGNLRREGLAEDRIVFAGDITYDAFLHNRDTARRRAVGLAPDGDYILLTMHRAETVDVPDKLAGVVEALLRLPLPAVFPVHPRTRKQLEASGAWPRLQAEPRLRLIDPVGYFEFLGLLADCRLVITDSGGVIKEAFYAEKFCVTMDRSTEYREELFDPGYNVLSGTKTADILDSVALQLAKVFLPPPAGENPFGDGRAGSRMVARLVEAFRASGR